MGPYSCKSGQICVGKIKNKHNLSPFPDGLLKKLKNTVTASSAFEECLIYAVSLIESHILNICERLPIEI